jgi:hypothetical protein
VAATKITQESNKNGLRRTGEQEAKLHGHNAILAFRSTCYFGKNCNDLAMSYHFAAAQRPYSEQRRFE